MSQGLLEPLERLQVPLNRNALVIGGGVAGMSAALNLGDQGFHTYLVEQKEELGGQALSIKKTWKDEDAGGHVMEIRRRVLDHADIEVLTDTKLIDVVGFVGNFTSEVQTNNTVRELNHGVAILAVGNGFDMGVLIGVNARTDRHRIPYLDRVVRERHGEYGFAVRSNEFPKPVAYLAE